jgi:hypothetical protein
VALAAERDGCQAVSSVLVCCKTSMKGPTGDADRVFAMGDTPTTGAAGADWRPKVYPNADIELVGCAFERQMDQRRERVGSGSKLHQVKGCPVLASSAVGMGSVWSVRIVPRRRRLPVVILEMAGHVSLAGLIQA